MDSKKKKKIKAKTKKVIVSKSEKVIASKPEKAIESGQLTGFLTKTSSGHYAASKLAVGSSNLTITNPDGVAGNPTLDLSSTPTVNQLSLSSGSQTTTLSSAATANYNLMLPTGLPTASGQALIGNTAGNLSWASSSGGAAIPNFVYITATGGAGQSWTVPSGVTAAKITLVGGGGAGGDAAAGGAGGGGGGGAYTSFVLTNLTAGHGALIVIGSGGIRPNLNGTSTTFLWAGTTTYTANGGAGAASGTIGGAGGSPTADPGTTSSYISLAGQSGANGISSGSIYLSGAGGNSVLMNGGGYAVGFGAATGIAGTPNSGGGASGSTYYQGQSMSGGSGICIIEYYTSS